LTLELKNIDVIVGAETYLAGINARFEAGIFNVLLGPTLAGKTSMLRIMAGLDAPSSGTLHMDGTDLTSVPVKTRSVAFVYQQFINYPNMSVFENIASPLNVAGNDKTEIAARVEKIAKLLSIDGMLDRKPLELSGGQQQRVALARALVREADLVLLDEPLANLDYKLREELRTELPRLFKETGSIVVYATTEPEEALLLGGNITLLHEGRTVQSGPTLEVYHAPKTLAAARTFSDPPLNVATATCTSGKMQLDGLNAAFKSNPTLTDGAYQIGFRAHHLYVEKPSVDALKVAATVRVTEIAGSESFIHVEALGERWTALAHGVYHHGAGETIALYLDPKDFMVFAANGKNVETANG